MKKVCCSFLTKFSFCTMSEQNRSSFSIPIVSNSPCLSLDYLQGSLAFPATILTQVVKCSERTTQLLDEGISSFQLFNIFQFFSSFIVLFCHFSGRFFESSSGKQSIGAFLNFSCTRKRSIIVILAYAVIFHVDSSWRFRNHVL